MSAEQDELLPSPEPIEAPPRVPNLAHAGLFLLLAISTLFAANALVLLAAGSFHSTDKLVAAAQDQRFQLLTMAIGYLATLLLARPIFARLWERPFARGLSWNSSTAAGFALRLVVLGFLLGGAVQTIESLMPMPKSIPMDEFFKNSATVWALTAFGTLLAPLFEEVAFRGFLLPAFAIAFDWLRLGRDPATHAQWRSTETLSRSGLILSGLLTSALFALMHAAQLGYTWPAVAILMAVSLVLTWVRVFTQSVAASTLVHACYNLSVFVTLFLGTDGYRHLERMTS